MGQKPNQPSKTHRAMKMLGRELLKMFIHKAKLFIPLIPHTPGLGLEGLKDTIPIFGGSAEDCEIHYCNKSL